MSNSSRYTKEIEEKLSAPKTQSYQAKLPNILHFRLGQTFISVFYTIGQF